MASSQQSEWYDLATGKLIDMSRPEEPVRQDFERLLLDDYGYDKSHLDIEVQIPRGTGFFPDLADIVIYTNQGAVRRDPTRDIWGIVELKKPRRRSGLAQLKSYMTATSAQWGVWTNGDDIAYLMRDGMSPAVLEDHLFTIPAFGQPLTAAGVLSKSELRPFTPQLLKATFRRILNRLYANTTISRREKLGGEMIKLIFAKIQDESTFLNQAPRFYVQPGEDHQSVKERIASLFHSVRDAFQADDVFGEHDTITLDAKSVAWVVGQLERWTLLGTDTDVVGDAFEVFAESKLVGEKGEFFTPRGIIRLAVTLPDPGPHDSICDPACGSGGFLTHAMSYVWDKMDRDPEFVGSPRLDQLRREYASQSIYGIDKEIDLVRIAKAYMAIAGDGRSNIVHENSLHAADEFEGQAKQHFVTGDSFKKFDFIFTNPPYGTKTKVVKEDAANFALGRKWSKRPVGSSPLWATTQQAVMRDPYILFVERCLSMLNDGGTMAIVLPESAFHAPTLGYVRQFLLENNSVRAIVDLPHNTFRPYCNAKTCMIVIDKGVPQQEAVLMAAPEEMGHDHTGRTLFRYGTNEEWDDLAIAHDELQHPADAENEFVFLQPWSEVDPQALIPRYYHALRYPALMPEGRIAVRLGDLVDDGILTSFDGHGSPEATEKGMGPVPYIRVSDVVNWELYRNPVSGVPFDVFEDMTKKKKLLQQDDVVFVRRGSYRIGTVAMASARDTQTLLTRELTMFRVAQPNNEFGITPHYLLALLSSKAVQEQIGHLTFIDTTLPNLGTRWRELILPIHEDEAERARVSRVVSAAMQQKFSAQIELDILGEDMGTLTR